MRPVPLEAQLGRRERPTETRQDGQVPRSIAPSAEQDLGVTADHERSEDLPRYTELIDGRGKITAKFTNLSKKTIRHRAKPEPPIKLERLEETTNKISLALEVPADVAIRQPDAVSGDCRTLPCHNGGTCANAGGSFACDCTPGFKGRQCELFCRKMPHPCTRLYSETKSVPVWEGGVCHYLYKRTYKVQQDVCYREVCETMLSKKTHNRRTRRQQ